MTKHAKNEREEIACDVFDNIPEKEKLEAMSNLSLAKLQESFPSDKACLIIIQNEWRRREQHTQHELNEKLFKKQEKFAYKIAFIGVFSAIIGAICGSLLQSNPTEEQLRHLVMEQIAQAQSCSVVQELARQADAKKEEEVVNTGKAKVLSSQKPPKI